MARNGLGIFVFALAVGQLRLAVAVVVVLLVANVTIWLRRTWSFDGETITFDDGVLRRTYRRVPVHRVQQVEVGEPLLHRAVGLAVVRIETAGSGGQAEVLIDALPLADATHLRTAVLSARAAARGGTALPTDDPETKPVPPPPELEQEVLRLGSGRLMLAGISSSNLLVVFVVLATVFDSIGRIPGRLSSVVEDEATDAIISLGLISGLLLLVAAALAVAALSSIATHHDLTVVRAGDELRLRRGLFERRDAVVPLARVQAIAVRQNPAQRLLGMSSMRIRSAGTGAGADARLLVPLARSDEVARLVEAALGRVVDLDALVPAPTAARARRIVRRLALAAIVIALVGVATPPGVVTMTVAISAVILVVVLGLDAYRSLGHRLDDDVFVVRWGSVVRRTVVVVVDRVQSVRVGSSPVQRWRGLGTMAVDMAGRGITPLLIDQSLIRCGELRRQMVGLRRFRGAEAGTREWSFMSPQPPNEEP